MKKLDENAIDRIAEVVHDTLRAWGRVNGQTVLPTWARAPQWMKTSSKAAIAWRLAHPDAPDSAQHDQWAKHKLADGWRFGRTKSGAKKTHPLLVPYADLPEVERRKDALVNAVIDALIRPIR